VDGSPIHHTTGGIVISVELGIRILAVVVLLALYVLNPFVGVAGLSAVFGYVVAQQSWPMEGDR
jgi:hypothetical protein